MGTVVAESSAAVFCTLCTQFVMPCVSGSDGRVIIWDVGQGKMLNSSGKGESSKSNTVMTLAFSRDSTVAAAGKDTF